MPQMKTLKRLYRAPHSHWVGDGFKVHNMFDYGEGAVARSPFLLMDYGAATTFAPNSGKPRGVGLHPHRGFKTVSVAYQGSISHHDIKNGNGTIGPGESQFMWAGSGLEHEEYHSDEFSKAGGVMEMVQLWVDLPRAKKMMPPRYQAILKNDVAETTACDGKVIVRVLAGSFGATVGPANVESPMAIIDLRMQPGSTVELPQPEGWTTMVVVLEGAIDVNGSPAAQHECIQMSHEGTEVKITSTGAVASKLLFLSGEPLNQPVVGRGPMVMCSDAEINQAFQDYRDGKFGARN